MSALRAEAALARRLSAIERGEPFTDAQAGAPGRDSDVIGLVGPPGAGKSTLIGSLIREIRSVGKTVAVLAVDPSSPVTGGAFLGDRVRIGEHSQDPGVFFRSFASRGAAGGLTAAMPSAVRAVRSAGWNVTIVEPVGGGQADVAIARIAPLVILVLSPESGDEMQIMKAGILEVADIVVVNKADRPGASRLHSALRSRWSTAPRRSVLLVEAQTGVGVPELWQLLQDRSGEDKPADSLAGTETPADAAALASAVSVAHRRVRAVLADPLTVDLLHDMMRAGAAEDELATQILMRAGQRM